MDEKDFTQFVKEIRNAEKTIGKINYDLTDKQIRGRSLSRSLYATQEIEKGDIFSKENVRSIRPGYGLHPKYLNRIIGNKAKRNINKGDRLTKNDL